MFALLLFSCAYSVEDWWSDLARTYCTCEQEDRVRGCRREILEQYGATDYANCADEPAPVDRAEMKAWMRDYVEACVEPDIEAPQPADPEWYLSCE